jgi:hypothetical protein
VIDFDWGGEYPPFHPRGDIMIKKKILEPGRIRHIDGGFSFIPHRFLTEGFVDALNQKELLLYLFLVLASDRYGLSFYAYDAICSYLGLSVDDYIEARDGLMGKDLIAFDGTLFQVLDLPSKPVKVAAARPMSDPDRERRRAHIKELIQQSLWGAESDR